MTIKSRLLSRDTALHIGHVDIDARLQVIEGNPIDLEFMPHHAIVFIDAGRGHVDRSAPIALGTSVNVATESRMSARNPGTRCILELGLRAVQICELADAGCAVGLHRGALGAFTLNGDRMPLADDHRRFEGRVLHQISFALPWTSEASAVAQLLAGDSQVSLRVRSLIRRSRSGR